MISTPISLIPAYAVPTSSIHHQGAFSQALRPAKLCGGAPARSPAWPVSAIERESCASSISSEKIVIVARCDACHAYSATSAR